MIKPNAALAAGATAIVATGGGNQYLFAYGTSWGTLTITHSPDNILPFVVIQTGVALAADGEIGFQCGPGFIKATAASVTVTKWGIDQVKAGVAPTTTPPNS